MSQDHNVDTQREEHSETCITLVLLNPLQIIYIRMMRYKWINDNGQVELCHDRQPPLKDKVR
jgi:hypothetical protein